MNSVLILTGAGISADSGVQTFRDAGGLWEGHRPEDVATPEAWSRDRAKVWRFYQQRRAQLATVEPNPAHRALADLGRRLASAGGKLTLVTQNVDDLHERGGSQALHMHGELVVLRCESCGHKVNDRERVDPDIFIPCSACSHDALRPDVVWFGEIPYFLDEIDRAVRRCTHFLAIGTSGHVWPAAGILHAARQLGAKTWVQALEKPSNLELDDQFRPGRAAETVPALVEELVQELGS